MAIGPSLPDSIKALNPRGHTGVGFMSGVDRVDKTKYEACARRHGITLYFADVPERPGSLYMFCTEGLKHVGAFWGEILAQKKHARHSA